MKPHTFIVLNSLLECHCIYHGHPHQTLLQVTVLLVSVKQLCMSRVRMREKNRQTDREIREATGGLYVCFYNDCLSGCVRMKRGVRRKRRVKNPHASFFMFLPG